MTDTKPTYLWFWVASEKRWSLIAWHKFSYPESHLDIREFAAHKVRRAEQLPTRSNTE